MSRVADVIDKQGPQPVWMGLVTWPPTRPGQGQGTTYGFSNCSRMPIDYSKWDNLDLSDDEDQTSKPVTQHTSSGSVERPNPAAQPEQFTLRGGFVLKTTSERDGRGVYLNVCSSSKVLSR